MTTEKRYELKIGKFGYYFYDNIVSINMTLEMVLNRLNYGHIRLEKFLESTNEQLNMINRLNRKITLLKEVKSK